MNRLSFKSWVFTGIALALTAGVVLFFLIQMTAKKSNEIQANLNSIKGNSLFVSAVYINPETGRSYSGEFTDVEITVGPDTKIIRRALVMPSQSELAKTGGRYKLEDLKRIESAVNLTVMQADMKQGLISLEAKANGNILNSKKFRATEITYRTFIYP